MAAELVRLHVDFIVTHYGQGVLSKQQNVMCRGNGSVKRQIITVAQRAALQLAPAKTSDHRRQSEPQVRLGT
jgi:hypothetical protein